MGGHSLYPRTLDRGCLSLSATAVSSAALQFPPLAGMAASQWDSLPRVPRLSHPREVVALRTRRLSAATVKQDPSSRQLLEESLDKLAAARILNDMIQASSQPQSLEEDLH